MLRKVIFMCLFLTTFHTYSDSDKITDLMNISLEELMNIKVITASNDIEKLSEASATTIVISSREIKERGYHSFSEILDDLPGIDLARPYGDTWFSSYWRGYRYNIGSPYLIMIDGMVLNHLYYNIGNIMDTFSLNNIQRIEIVYGPSSAVYGPNAFMGVINVITQPDNESDGHSINSSFTIGSFSREIADMYYSYKNNSIGIRLAARLDSGNIDIDSGENNTYTQSAYLNNQNLWGGFLDNPSVSGNNSPHHNKSMDLRVHSGNLEFGYQYFLLDTGYGYVYPTDKAQRNSHWKLEETNTFMLYTRNITSQILSRTLIRYRTSSVPGESFFIEGYETGDGRVVDFSYWQTINSSASINQDFNISLNEKVSIVAGFKFEEKDLQKGYNTNYGPSLDPETFTNYPYPEPITWDTPDDNRITAKDKGVYLHSKYRFTEATSIQMGLRHDDNSGYGGTTIFRGVVMHRFGNIVGKLLVGEAFQEPVPRLLYGGWQGSGSDPNLKPETSRTYEMSLGRSQGNLSQMVSMYFVDASDTILNVSEGAVNLGKRNIFGIDYHLKSHITVDYLDELKTWMYYSYIRSKGDEIIDINTNTLSHEEIGDISSHKLHFGVNAIFNSRWSASFSGRYIGKRNTVATNPVKEVDGYFTGDINIIMKDIFTENLTLSLRITNIFDTSYFHPGIREANGGVNEGEFNEAGFWSGSQGWFNSLLPQPGRAIYLSLHMNF